MLQDEITSGAVAAEALLLRAASTKTVMIVEGSDDLLLLQNYIDDDGCDIILAYGKENALDALSILEMQGFKGVICVVDADFWHIEGFPELSPNVVWTDEHDLDVVLFRSPACAKLLRELGSRTKLKRITAQGKTVHDLLLTAAAPIGYTLMFSLRYGINLKFSNLDYDFVDRTTLETDVGQMVQGVLNKSRMHEFDYKPLAKFLEENLASGHDLYKVCRGHDLRAILSKALQRLVGSMRQVECHADELGRKLRLAYERAFFEATELFAAIRSWEARNPPFIVLG